MTANGVGGGGSGRLSIANSPPILQRYRWPLLWLTSLLLLLPAGWLGLSAWRHLAPPVAASGWHYRPLLLDLPRVSALALGPAEQLFVSLESRTGDGKILMIAENGDPKEVLGGLHKPDGMVAYENGIAITQEEGIHWVIGWQKGVATNLFQAKDAEGIARDDNFLYVVEDQHGTGRLLRFDTSNGEVVTLRDGLDEAEGVTLCPGGDLYYVEKGASRVRRLTPDGEDPVVVAGLNQPAFLLCQPEGLWITEDATHGARLLLLDRQSNLRIILSHLRAPQTLLATGPDRYLLAEQGRDRILEIWRATGTVDESDLLTESRGSQK